jgi:hypothetical protein
MRLLSFKRVALATLKSENNARHLGLIALVIRRDTGVSVVTAMRNNLSIDPPPNGRVSHFFHYEHKCAGQHRIEAWFTEAEMPNVDGDHLVCPVCKMVGLRVETVPQQASTLVLIGTQWPPP